MKLAELASLIRSKNAGPFVLTFDIMFADDASYLRVKDSGAMSIARFAKLFRCPENSVQFFACDNARAFKFSIPRPLVQGNLGDGDLHGGQQFIPLMDIEIP
jgi:Domain of unknown function (DUF4387)